MQPPEDEELSVAANASVSEDTPELASLIAQMRQDEQKLNRRKKVASAAPQALKSIAHIGCYMPPSEVTYAAHAALVNEPSLGLGFSQNAQPAFDALLHHASPNHLHILAALRNALLVQTQSASHLMAMARFIDKKFNNGWQLLPDGKGAQQLYRALLKRQNTPLWLMPSVWLRPADWPQRWGLSPLNDSPFSDEGLQRPAPAPTAMVSAVENFEIIEMAERNSMNAAEPEAKPDTAQELNAIANDMASVGALTMSVEELHEPTRRESIEIAKDILKKLKVQLGEALLVKGLSQFDFNPLLILADLKHAVKVFEFHLHKVAGLDSNIYENPAVAKANAAVGKLSFLAKQETAHAAQSIGDAAMLALVQADLSQFPKSWQPAENDVFSGLLDDLESGLKAVLERINQLADKDAGAEYWLGFSSEKTLGVDPSKGKNSPEKKMEDDTYYRQLNAQRALRARQAAVRYTQSMQRQRMHHSDDGHHHQPPSAKSASMSTILSSDMVNAMRNAMKTSANTAQVETGTKANIQNVVKQKEQVVKATRQRITQEQIRRSNERSKEAPKEVLEPIQPPPGKKKDHGHGL